MLNYVIRRFAFALLSLGLVVSLVFALTFAAGDPARAALGQRATPQQLEDFRKKHGLDHPIHHQLGAYIGVSECLRDPEEPNRPTYCGVLQGDFGESYIHHEPVADAIGRRLPRTLLLGVMTMFIELLLGIGAGILAAVNRNRWEDLTVLSATFLAISVPTIVSGPLALAFFSFRLGWFPVGGYGATPWDHIVHAILPATVLALGGTATYARIMRGELIEVLGQDHVRTARAKGAGPLRVLFVHGVRNAMLAVVTLIGLSLPALVSGAIITEKIFGWPGLGSLTIEAIQSLDAPVVMAVVLMFGVAVQVGNFVADVALALLDPRVRLGS